jgi:putative heme iron utilization protein
MDIEASAGRRFERLRVGFETPLATSHDAHMTLVSMAKAAKGSIQSNR